MTGLGVMQGRLLPKYKGLYQSFPIGYWQDEFPIAKKLGLDCIEFIIDDLSYPENPLMTEEGVRQIQHIVAETGVQVKTICADYFMEHPFHDVSQKDFDHSMTVLGVLLENGRKLGVTDIVIPCVDKSSLLNKKQHIPGFIVAMKHAGKLAQASGINLSLETDLGPQDFRDLLLKIDSPRLKVNYDIGNSAALGYLESEEIAAYGEWISDVHIKDRVLGGGSVPVGTGDAKIENALAELKKAGYSGVFIMQVYRDDEGVEIFKFQKEKILPILKKYFP